MRGSSGRGVSALAVAALLGVGGCSTTAAPPVEEAVAGSDELAATMSVETGADEVRLTLHVTNVSAGPVELEFTSGQRYDFAVTDADGETLWTWSADRSFMQALGSETLEPGASLRYTEAWPSGGRRGEFVGVGRVTSTSHPVRQSVIFELGGSE